MSRLIKEIKAGGTGSWQSASPPPQKKKRSGAFDVHFPATAVQHATLSQLHPSPLQVQSVIAWQ